MLVRGRERQWETHQNCLLGSWEPVEAIRNVRLRQMPLNMLERCGNKSTPLPSGHAPLFSVALGQARCCCLRVSQRDWKTRVCCGERCSSPADDTAALWSCDGWAGSPGRACVAAGAREQGPTLRLRAWVPPVCNTPPFTLLAAVVAGRSAVRRPALAGSTGSNLIRRPPLITALLADAALHRRN